MVLICLLKAGGVFSPFPESALWNHRRGDFHPRKYAARGLAGGLPGDAREKRPSRGADETPQTRSRGENGLFSIPPGSVQHRGRQVSALRETLGR